MSGSTASIRDIAATARGRRQRLNMTQADVARLAGVSRQWVSEFESGKPTAELRLALRLLDALGLSLKLEQRDADEPEPPPAGRAVDLDKLLDEHRDR